MRRKMVVLKVFCSYWVSNKSHAFLESSWFDFRVLGKAQSLQIPNLTEEEIEFVADYFPRIDSLLPVERLRPILENPFMLNLIPARACA